MRFVHGRRRGTSLAEIERVYRTRFDEYHRVAAAVLDDPDRARDAVQEAFAAAVRKRGSFRGEGPLEAWIWRAVVNTALNQRRGGSPELLGPGRNGDSPDHRPDDDRAEELRGTLRLLPERQRLALFLRYYADLDYATIGAVLGISEGTVAATLHTAHSALRRRLEEVRL
jgi:RNA polymerase sigma-70 factor, ECF subfamily